MKKLQGSRIAKICMVVILLAAAYGAGTFGVFTVQCVNNVFLSSWEDSVQVYRALADRCNELQEGVELYLRMNELERQTADGEENMLTLADIEYIQERLDQLREQFDRSNTWFRFRLMSEDRKRLLATNLTEGEALAQVVSNVYTMRFAAGDGDEQYQLIVQYGVPEKVSESIRDEFYQAYLAYEEDRTNFDLYLTGFLNLSALTLLALIFLLWSCGHKAGEPDIVLTWQEKIYFDLYLFVMFWVGLFLGFWGVVCVEQMFDLPDRTSFPYHLMPVLASFSFTGFVGVLALTLRTFAVRLKARALVRTTLLCRVVTWTVHTVQVTVYEFLLHLPFIWKALGVFGIYFLFTLFGMETWYGFGAFLFFVGNIAVFLGIGWWAIGMHRLQEGTRAIASGNLDHKIDTRYMPMDLRAHAEDLNNISVGMHSAVEEQMKSERFKAELITNVSHDLKTPLTSIINYVNLLQTTEQTDPKAAEYIEVLDRKSQRLKKLTEDLVEASKASTGVLSVSREKIGMCQLLDQALGEYGEKLEARRLSVIRTVPEEEIYVYADGRHLWRVMDNLLANCAKYAMEGTRVYVEVSRGQGKGVFSVKNISKEPLNVPADQLMERFVRGDSARSTEGSGLGLSIARSLTELQAGSFELAVDGDLFKAVVTLPQYGG